MTEPENVFPTSMDVAAEKRSQLKGLLLEKFPEVFAEGGIDFDQLKRVLGDWVEPSRERFGLNWAGKTECMKVIQQPSAATLRPTEKDSLNFGTSQNIFIEGDNLEVLKLLQKSYFGKIKAIYIDPPYNTGKEFIYPDKYAENLDTYLSYTGQVDDKNRKFSTNTDTIGRYHSNWLNMMYPRIYLARNLLSDDGVILISIDENEFHNLKKLADEIFGEMNYAGEIIWKNSSKNDQDYISIQHEYILIYAKNKDVNKGDWLEKKEGLDDIYKAFDNFRAKYGKNWEEIHKAASKWFKEFPESNPIYASKHYSWTDDVGVYFPADASGPNFGQYVYDVFHPKTGKVVKAPSRGWFCPEEKMRRLVRDQLIHFGPDETTVPCQKTYLKNTEYRSITSVKFKDGRAASKRLQSLFGEKVFTNPKDEQLLKDLFKAIGVKGDDIVLDFFAGSGTTGQAVIELNEEQKSSCRYILVQLPENLSDMQSSGTGSAKVVAQNAIKYLQKLGLPQNICEIAKQRMRLVADSKKPKNDAELDFGTNVILDVGFKVFALDASNFKLWNGMAKDFDDSGAQLELHVDHVSHSASPKDILFELLLKAGFPLTTPITSIEIGQKQVFSVEGGSLLICLEKEITSELIDGLANANPLQVICMDEGFKGNDQLKANAVQTFKARAQAEETEIVFRTV